jgi:peptidoglycan/LPS O-acetylase OafA/YrhL
MQKDKMTRHYAIDWIRIIATLAIFVFHSGQAYTVGNWHLNNPERVF